MVFKNNVMLSEGALPLDYDWDGTNDIITFHPALVSGDKVVVVYKHQTPSDGGEDDIAAHTTESKLNTPVPYVIGEWCFDLEDVDMKRQFRAVTVYGLTDRHNADDNDAAGETWSSSANVVDSEVKYYLNETFNPWDLYSAVEKDTRSWVEWTTATTSYTTLRKPVIQVSNADWDQYCVSSERVILGGSLLKRPANYTITYNADGTANILGMPSGTKKILYNTKPDVTGASSQTDSWAGGIAYNTTTLDISSHTVSKTWNDTIGAIHGFSLAYPGMNVYGTNRTTSGAGTNWTETWSLQKIWNETNFKVFLGETYTSTLPNLYDPINVTQTNGNVTFMFDLGGALTKTLTATSDSKVISPLPAETVHVAYLNHQIDVSLSVTQRNYTDANGATTNQTWTSSLTITVTASYRDFLMGRYEWTTVGRDAQTVDSAGASLVTAAFKDKQVEIGLAGADMNNSVAANAMPWVMAKWGGTGDTKNDYYKVAGTDYRTALKDDWCTKWPVASSNMIGVGGLYANLLAYYANDFTNAFFGTPDFTAGSPYSGMITGIPCWNRGWNGTWNVYSSSSTTGYAVISTYKDINGTVLFLIWGHWGRDTYYVTQWFHEWEIYELQSAPRGITSIIVQISYPVSDPTHPTFSIVECLGTISERTWSYQGITKGGIHDP
jgi:hypothetical protein